MGDDYTQLNLGAGGDAVDEEGITYGSPPTTRKRTRIVVAGNTAEKLASVTNTTPGATDYGLVTRGIAVTGASSGAGTSNIVNDETVLLLRKIMMLLESNAVVDTRRRQRVTVEAIGTTPTDVGTSMPVTSTPVAGAINMGNVTIQFGAQATAAAAGVDSRFFMMDTARNAYANGIRTNLVWS